MNKHASKIEIKPTYPWSRALIRLWVKILS